MSPQVLRKSMDSSVVLMLALCGVVCGCTSQTASPLAKKENVAKTAAIAAEVRENRSEAVNSHLVGEASQVVAPASDVHSNKEELNRPKDLEKSQDLVQPETWTSKRLVVLAPGGVVLVDIAVNIGATSLEQELESTTNDVLKKLLQEATLPIQWPKLLENAVIQSGWLGNLVPMENQVDQILNLYDLNRDGMSSREELAAFLTRGASRNKSLPVTQAEAAEELLINKSPWGPGDLNEDGVLDQDELARLSESLLQADFNGDQCVSQTELQTATNLSLSAAAMNSNGSLIEQDLLIDWNVEKSPELARRIVDHYAFTEEVSRDDWFQWKVDRWKMIDTDNNAQLSSQELRRLGEVPADAQFQIRFPNCLASAVAAVTTVSRIENSKAVSSARWIPGNSAFGQLSLGSCWLRIEVADTFSDQARRVFDQQLRAAFGNPQLKMIFSSRLELQSTAFDLLDSDADGKLSDLEVQTAWNWFACIRQLRLSARGQSSLSPWFRIADQDGNRRLTLPEINQFRQTLLACDRDHSLSIEPSELPLAMSLSFSRENRGLNLQELGVLRNRDRSAQELPSDWYYAMDANEDGFLSRSEFLGYPSDFDSLDRDKDGFISRTEVPHSN